MKLLKSFAIIAMIFSSTFLLAQTETVSVENSSVSWTGTKIGGSHNGNISLKSGSLNFKNGNITSGSFVMDMTSITNLDIDNAEYNKKLVGHLMSEDFFGVEKFPEATFMVTKSSPFSNGKATVEGNLTIKGKTEAISFDVTKASNAYAAKITVDRSKFDIRYGSKSFFDNLGDKVIHDEFTLDLKLVMNK